jgi:hypothetical protein
VRPLDDDEVAAIQAIRDRYIALKERYRGRLKGGAGS